MSLAALLLAARFSSSVCLLATSCLSVFSVVIDEPLHRLACRGVSIVSNARENNTREQNLGQGLKQKQMLRVAQLLVPTYPKCANHDNLNGCQYLMFFASLNNLESHQ